MKKYFILISLGLVACSISILPQSQFESFIQYVNSLPGSSLKSAAIDSFINYARTQGIPFIESNTANYFLRGPYSSVEITGDFNEFYPYLDLTRLTGTDFFYYSDQYELNARLDYEYRINGSTIIIDPENPDSILGYYGYKSELAMPDYIQPWEIVFNSSVQHGSIISSSIYSNIVSHTYQLLIYLPPEYSSTSSDYPTAYFQDGSSYTDWGSVINVIDNLIASKKIEPIIAVFVVPNDRNQEYAFSLRNLYSQFFVDELVPFIDSTYRIINQANKRLVMGDSYGGNISALISYNHPDVFGNCGLQSAALHPNDYEAYNLFVRGEVKDIKISTIWGSYDDRNYYLTELKDSLISRGYQTDWLVLPEGHSWGLWRATVDTMLQYFFPANATPVELAFFSGYFDGENVNLYWHTATEVNNLGFEIERSADGYNFKKVGFVPGEGTTTLSQYYFYLDSLNITGIIYYRIKQLDYDGKFEYSKILVIRTDRPHNQFILNQNYPNPFNPNTKISFQIPEASEVKITIFNILGEEVKILINDFKETGFYEIEFNASDLPNGIYLYKLSTLEFSIVMKMLLLK